MAINETYSQRQKRLSGQDQVDLYRYDELPVTLRRQVILILFRLLGEADILAGKDDFPNNVWAYIHDSLAMEFGVFNLGYSHDGAYEQCRFFLENTNSVLEALDFIEFSFRLVTSDKIQRFGRHSMAKIKPQQAVIDELNQRFRKAGVGYQFVNDEIIRIDSQFIHSEAVVPVLTLLSDPKFKTAEEEFTQAHAHYRRGEYEDAIVDAERAFESVMKIILSERGWSFDSNDAANRLLDHLVTGISLVPTDFKDGLAGLPRIRNRFGGHGQGANQVVVPEYYANYALHLAASNILFLIEAYKKL